MDKGIFVPKFVKMVKIESMKCLANVFSEATQIMLTTKFFEMFKRQGWTYPNGPSHNRVAFLCFVRHSSFLEDIMIHSIFIYFLAAIYECRSP